MTKRYTQTILNMYEQGYSHIEIAEEIEQTYRLTFEESAMLIEQTLLQHKHIDSNKVAV